MADNREKILACLDSAFPHQLKDILQTFERCSCDDANGRNLVNNQTKAINFDKLTKWLDLGQGVKSADAMTLATNFVYFIEFKSGNQTEPEPKKEKLIRNVTGKIDDSANTLYSSIYPMTDIPEGEHWKIRFYLVVEPQYVDAVEMLNAVQLGLSTAETQEKYKNTVLPRLSSSATYPEYFDNIDVWYSNLFDLYLKKHRIEDIVLPTPQNK